MKKNRLFNISVWAIFGVVLLFWSFNYFDFSVFGGTRLGVTLQTNTDLRNGLLGHWTMDGKDTNFAGATDQILDTTGNKRHATLDGASFGSDSVLPGKVGQSLDFDGSDDSLSVTGTGLDNEHSFTWAMWFKRENGDRMTFIQKGGTATADKLLEIEADDQIRLFVNTDSTDAQAITSAAYTDSGWHHLAATYDTNGDRVPRIYVDGVEVSSYQIQSTATGSELNDSGDEFTIGDRTGSYGSIEFEGRLDDVRAYSKALSADEISRLYHTAATTKFNLNLNTNPALAEGLVGHWTFNGKDFTDDGVYTDNQDVASTTYDATTVVYTDVTYVDEDSFAIAYRDSGNDINLVVYNVNGTQELGITEVEGLSLATGYANIARIDEDSVAISYQDSGFDGEFVIYNIDGTEERSDIEFEPGFVGPPRMTAMGTSSLAIAWPDIGSGSQLDIAVYNIDGSQEMATSYSANISNLDIASVDGDSFVVSYAIAGVEDDGEYIIYNVDGTVELAATDFEVGTVSDTSVVTMPGDLIAISYVDLDAANVGKFVVYDTSGSSVTSAVTFESGTTDYTSIKRFDDDSVIIAYIDDGDSGRAKYVIVNIDGTIEFGPQDIGTTNAVDFTRVSMVDKNTFAITFADTGDSSDGKFVVNTYDTTKKAVDISSSGNDGTRKDTEKASGKIGQGLTFDGNSHLVSVGTGPTSVKTVAFWIKTSSTTAQKIIDIDGTDMIEIDASKDVVATSFPGTTIIYVDGVVSARLDDAWRHVVVTDTTGVNAASLEFGRAGNSYFEGSLDDIRLYDKVLTATDVNRLYHLGGTTKIGKTVDTGNNDSLRNGLIGHWTMDGKNVAWGDTTSEVKDSSPSDIDGNSVNMSASASSRPGRIGQGLEFDGINYYIDMGAPSVMNITGAMSVSAWIRPTDTNDYQGVAVKFGGSGSPGVYQWIFGINSTDNFAYYNNNAGWNSLVETVSYDKWQHIVYVYDGTNMRVYKDNVPNSTVGIAAPPSQATYPLYVGSGWGAGFTNYFFDGIIDDVRIYDRAITATEVDRLYKMGR